MAGLKAYAFEHYKEATYFDEDREISTVAGLAGYEADIEDNKPLTPTKQYSTDDIVSVTVGSVLEAAFSLYQAGPITSSTSSQIDEFPMSFKALSSASDSDEITSCPWQNNPIKNSIKEISVRAMSCGNPSLTGIPVELRVLVYGYFWLPFLQMVHLTYSPQTSVEQLKPVRHSLSGDVQSLLLTCRKLNNELSDLIYSRNDFLFTPGHQNYNTSTFPHSHSNSELWLSHLRLSTRMTVNKVRVYLDMDLQRDSDFVSGLVNFPEIEITVMPLFTVKAHLHPYRIAKLKELCRSIKEARAGSFLTTWFDGGNAEVAGILLESVRIISETQ